VFEKAAGEWILWVSQTAVSRIQITGESGR